MVPVDYVSRAIVASSIHDHNEINICTPDSVRHIDWMSKLLERVGVFDYSFVSTKPSCTLNRTETLFYRTVHKAMGPYVCCSPVRYLTDRLQETLGEHKPPDVLAHLDSLIDFAIERRFVPDSP